MCFPAWESNNSWTDTNCDQRESAYGWDRSQHNFDFQQFNQISNLRAPCSACTIPNNVGKSIEFELRGLCERFCSDYCFFYVFCRSGFDTDFMVNNDEETGLISYIGKIFPDIEPIKNHTNDKLFRKEIHENPVRPKPVPVEYFGVEQPKNISRLILGCINDGNW